MAGGRPSVYSQKMIEQAERYIIGHKDFGDIIPNLAGLADVLGVTRETVYAWRKDDRKPEFSYIVNRLLQKQERCLLNGGLGGDYNPTITKLILTKHGYSDRVETDHTSSDGTMTPTQIVIRAADENGDD